MDQNPSHPPDAPAPGGSHRVARTEVVHDARWCRLLAKYVEGDASPYYSLANADYVNVMAVTNDDAVLLVRQYRPAVERWTIELPGGTVDPGERPDEAARRELREETGYRAVEFHPLGVLCPDTGRLSNRQWCYFTRVERDPEPLRPEASESDLSRLLMPRAAFAASFGAEGGFDHALHIAVVALAIAKGLFSLA